MSVLSITEKFITTSFHGKTRNARCEFAFESSYSLPRKREKLYCVCLVDDASGGTDHINWSASVECTDYARVRKEGILDGSILTAEPHRRIRVCTLLCKLVPRAMHTRAKPLVHELVHYEG